MDELLRDGRKYRPVSGSICQTELSRGGTIKDTAGSFWYYRWVSFIVKIPQLSFVTRLRNMLFVLYEL